jgi:hypothetical protein
MPVGACSWSPKRLARFLGGYERLMAAGIAGSLLITVWVGILAGIFRPAGIFDPDRRRQMQDELAGRDPRPIAPRPEPTSQQWAALAAFMLGLTAVVVLDIGVLRDVGLFLAAGSLVALAVFRIRSRRARR